MRWLLIWVCALGLLLGARAAVEILDLPDTQSGEPLDTRYDIEWTATPTNGAGPLLLDVEMAAGSGYQLQLEKGQAVWQRVANRKALPITTAALRPSTEQDTYHFTLKRREGVVALLQDHRLLFAAPATLTGSDVAFHADRAAFAVKEARYRPVERRFFGDDFMRPESGLLQSVVGTREDQIWKVAFYRKDFPFADASNTDGIINPWQQSYFVDPRNGKPNYDFAANGFWFMYRGVGPSWVVAEPNTVYPTWDRYYVEASVKPEYESTVGLIAGYQDNRNYLLFRWQSSQGNIAGPRAELIAMVDGKPRTLATAARGFAPTQWYRLRMNLGWETAQVLVNGKLLLDAPNPGAVEGRIGLYADGVLSPNRPKLDDSTATMYVTTDEKTGRVTNEAAEAMRGNSVIYFDDVKVGDWIALDDIFQSPYAQERTGAWTVKDRVATTRTGGRLLSGLTDWDRYEVTTAVALLQRDGATVYFHMSPDGTGYAWVLGPTRQTLHPVVRYTLKPAIATATTPLKLGEWTPLRIEAEGPYVALFCGEKLVLDAYDRARTAGRCGVEMAKGSAAFAPFSITQFERRFHTVKVHEGFEKNGWMATWSAPEADWYPAVNHGKYIRLPSEANPRALSDPGPSGPLYTDVPGLYWHKGAHYHDFEVTLPISAATLDGPMLHLATNYDAANGYRLQFAKGANDTTGKVTLFRKDAAIGTYAFTLSQSTRLIFTRRGQHLLLYAQALDPEGGAGDEPIIESEQTVFAYRDPAPLKAEMVGFTVAQPALPAAYVRVVSDRVQETFEQAPTGWTVGDGVWLVMNRYTCQPQWDWFGGFGKGLPHVWCSTRLDGDQNVEVYAGIKMQFDNQMEEYNKRFRDLNMSICTDGVHVNSGYSVVRGGKVNGRLVTMLLRKNTVVATSTAPGETLPTDGSGHRQWFATRMEKRGAEIKVFTNNKLTFTYVDPDPIPGGYAAFWTLDNGMLLGRVNLSAETMTSGQPQAFTPLAVQQELAPQAVPALAMDGVTAPLATFETGLDGFRERPESVIGARLIRERETDPQRGANTYLRAINSDPGGDFSFSFPVTGISLAKRPLLHLDYNFDPEVRVNLYAKVQGTWYEFLLNGKEAQEANVAGAGKASVTADGRWHHLALDLGTPITDALKADGKPVTDLTLQELVIANWETSADARWYGFGVNVGRLSLRLDNVILMPAVAGPATLSWSGPNADTTAWRTALDANPWAIPSKETQDRILNIEPTAALRFLHVQVKDADGKWGPVVHLPVPPKGK